MTRAASISFAVLLFACVSEDGPQPETPPTLTGNWRHASYEVTQCDDPDGDMENICNESAAICGVLTLTENTWKWSITLPDGSHHFESGSYSVSTNYILLTGGSGPGSVLSPISGSTFTFDKTALVFTNSSVSTGCVYIVSFVRYNKPFSPFG